MATKNFAYDHPQYLVQQAAGGVLHTLALGTRRVAYVAFVDSIMRAVHITKVALGTNTAATNVGHFLGIHIGVTGGSGVASGTATLVAAGDFGTSAGGTSVLQTATLTRGQSYVVYNTGTDAAFAAAIGFEVQPIAGANVTS